MTLDLADKKWVEGLVDKFTPIANQGDGDDKELLFHLYDQLWENMRAKENRLWSFLSLYGAAVGLIFAGGQASGLPGAELFALVIVMGLTTWAVLILLNANYWIRRNLLMVGGIEKRYPEIAKGIYPREFPEAKRGSFDTLYRGSIIVLSILLLLFFARAVWPYRNSTSFDTFHIFFSVILLYVIFASFALYCLEQHEDYIALFHATKREQLLKAEDFRPEKWQEALNDELDDRKKLSVRPYILLLLLCVIILFDFILIRNGYAGPYYLWCITPQLLLIIGFSWQWYCYRKPYKPKTALASLQNVTGMGLLAQVRQEWDKIKSNTNKKAELKPQFDELANKIDGQIPSLDSSLTDMKNQITSLNSSLTEVKKHVESLLQLGDPSITKELDKMLADLNRLADLNKIEPPTTSIGDVNWAINVDNIADRALDVKWYKLGGIKIPIILVILSIVNPIYFLYTNRPKLREDFMSGTKAISSSDLNQQIEKARQDLTKIENSFQELHNAETQRQLVDQKILPLQQRLEKLESQQQEMLKPQSSPTP